MRGSVTSTSWPSSAPAPCRHRAGRAPTKVAAISTPSTDPIRSARALVVGHQLAHVLMGENDRRISLLDRALEHCRATARYSVYYGEGRDSYDVPGRTAHESIFNVNDGRFRCPSTQQGYSPFSTWTRGLAWAMCGFAEQLEFLDARPDQSDAAAVFERAARATCDFYIENTPPEG